MVVVVRLLVVVVRLRAVLPGFSLGSSLLPRHWHSSLFCTLRVAVCKMLCASCCVQDAVCKMQCSECCVQNVRCCCVQVAGKIMCGSCFVQNAVCQMLCARCCVQVALLRVCCCVHVAVCMLLCAGCLGCSLVDPWVKSRQGQSTIG